MQVDVFITIHIGTEHQMLAVEREVVGSNFPFVFGEPLDLLRREAQGPDVFVAIRCIGGEQDGFPVGRHVVGREKLLAIMRRQQGALSRAQICHEDIGVSALGLFLGVDDVFSVLGPDGVVVAFVLRGV